MTTQKVARNPVSKGRSPMPRCKGRSVSSPRLRRHPKSSAVLAHDHRTPRHAVREQLDGLRHGHHDHPGGAPPPHPRGPRTSSTPFAPEMSTACPLPSPNSRTRTPPASGGHLSGTAHHRRTSATRTVAFRQRFLPQPGHPVTLSAFGQLAPSEVRQAARQQSAVERQSHMSRVRQALAFVAPLVGAFALYKVVSGGVGGVAVGGLLAALLFDRHLRTCRADVPGASNSVSAAEPQTALQGARSWRAMDHTPTPRTSSKAWPQFRERRPAQLRGKAFGKKRTLLGGRIWRGCLALPECAAKPLAKGRRSAP